MSRIAFAALCALAMLGGCAARPGTKLSRTAQPVEARSKPAPAGEAVWHLRAGLNVAALSCRGSGRQGVAGGYRKVLSRHKALLAAAYTGEQRRHGKALDRHLTQVYNRFAYQPSPAKFCTKAAAVAAEAAAMDSPTLSGQAGRLLGRL